MAPCLMLGGKKFPMVTQPDPVAGFIPEKG
jgi:hypothetical protein